MNPPSSPAGILPSRIDLHLKLTEISFFIKRKLRDYFEPAKISLNQYRVLTFLKGEPNLSLSSLEEKVLMKKGNLSRIVDSMVRQGYINRERDKVSDRRKIALTITQKGSKKLAELDTKQRDLINSMYAPIPDEELKSFYQFLTNLQHYLRGIDE